MRTNRIDKRITGIALTILIGLGFLFWWASTPDTQMERPTQETVQAEADKTTQRRARTGPRKPPPVSPHPADVPVEPDDEGDTSEEGEPAQPAADAEKQADLARKLQEYHEHLDVLDKPNVSELTMLGEMAFDANQAEDAYEHYLEVIENHTDDPMAPFALYKLAWTEYNLGDVEAAIDDMALVMEWLDDSASDGENPMLDALEAGAPADLELFRSHTD